MFGCRAAGGGMHQKREKSEEITAGLNVLIPGAGFAYLGQWGWAALNVLVFLVLLIVGGLIHHPLIVWFVVVLFGASFAVKAAKRYNEGLVAELIERLESQPSAAVGEAGTGADAVMASRSDEMPPPPQPRASPGVPPPHPPPRASADVPPPPPRKASTYSQAPVPPLEPPPPPPRAAHVSEPLPRATYSSEPSSASSNSGAAPAHRFCSTCGAPAEGARFCPQCGAQLMPKA
jgi:hypothetical protein